MRGTFVSLTAILVCLGGAVAARAIPVDYPDYPPTRVAVVAGECGGPRSSPLAYGWPIRPFDAPHPVRGNFGDPRTVYWGSAALASLGGSFTFHNGVDISAAPGTRVYPVLSGRVTRVGYEVVVVRTRHRVFQYWHIHPAVAPGEAVVARETVLGTVFRELDHVHLTEIDGTTAVNPLAPGHLTPYWKHTRPVVASVSVRAEDAVERAGRVHGRVWLVANAFDFPALLPPAPWGERPVAPALVAWSLRGPGPHGHVVVRLHAAVDFRRRLPRERSFWRVYAHGSYQNQPVVGRTLERVPGRYLFDLTPSGLRTERLANGRYRLTVVAADVCGNRSRLVETLAIRNMPQAVSPSV